MLVLVTARVAGVMLIAPIWSMSGIPTTVRGAIAVVVSLVLLPSVPHVDVSIDAASVVVPLLTEMMLGVAIGLSSAVFLSGISVAAEVISLQMGLSLGPAIGGMSDTGSPGVGQLESQVALMVYVSLGGHIALLGAIARSFHAVPPGAPLALSAGARSLLELGGTVFVVAVQVAAPMLVALLVTNLGLAILNRAVPQLNTMMVAVPITVSVGLITIGAALPYTVRLMANWAMSTGPAADAMVRALTPVVAH